MAHHRLPASVETIHWGYFDAGLRPVLTVASGDTVELDSVSGNPWNLPGEGFRVLPELLEVHARVPRELQGHIMTGPIAVEGARPGDMLEVRFLDIRLRQDWGYNMIRPLVGTLPDDFPEPFQTIIPLDADRMTGRLPWGPELPLRPFFGCIGTAPPPAWGRITSLVPRAHAGNIDLKELVAGTSLFLPVFVDGALLSAGDGHGCQGDGEVNVTAIETALTGTMELILHRGAGVTWPRAETPTHYITLGIDPDLDRCAERALREMIALIVDRAGIRREEAYTLCSLAADLRITQTVNGSKGVHCMIEKHLVDG
ncbi:MAG TPA: acetamidase/formamidase family protein [Paracoccaceae bacterium]|nr:acetamidase/formamidase family protein [Paracoccaceae bacterium]